MFYKWEEIKNTEKLKIKKETILYFIPEYYNENNKEEIQEDIKDLKEIFKIEEKDIICILINQKTKKEIFEKKYKNIKEKDKFFISEEKGILIRV